MKKLIEKVLTDKSARDEKAMGAYVASVASVGFAWGSEEVG